MRSYLHSPPRRAGMLLLMVLLMLSLFLAVGAMLLTIAARARSAARANAALAQASLTSSSFVRDALDEALLSLVRGSAYGVNGAIVSGTAAAPQFESILHDKYGAPARGTGSNLTALSPAVLRLTLTNLLPAVSQPSRLNGRVLTIIPAEVDGDILSFRILNAFTTGAAGTECHVANVGSRVSQRLPASNKTFDVVINGREFTPLTTGSGPEAFDAYDDASDFYLAQPVLATGNTAEEIGQLSHYNRASFFGDVQQGNSHNDNYFEDNDGNPRPNLVDNDNDGLADGVWITTATNSLIGRGTLQPRNHVPHDVLPDRPSPLGGSLRFQVSYLVLDLDGRININACGLATPASGTYPAGVNVPLGMGYGPADVDPSLLFPITLPSPSGTSAFTGAGVANPAGLWSPHVFGGSPSNLGTPSPSLVQMRPPPLVGIVHGRYGPNGQPGGSADDNDGHQLTMNTATGYQRHITGTNTIADLQGRLQVYMSGATSSPKLTFFSPTPPVDGTNDPYELRLDEHAPRWGTPRRSATAGNDDSPFTLAELERILRATDSDAPQLPQRLAATLSDYAQRTRGTITTDSWDTPGLTGDAARRIEDFIANVAPHQSNTVWSGPNAVFSPEVAAGLRFDLNRPLLSDSDKQEYCRGLYALAVALNAPPDQAAQWAVNAVDFRDPDSTCTRFAYDTTLTDGWQPPAADTNEVVWGMERPELVIQRATVNAMTGQLEVALLHPFRDAVIKVGAAADSPVEVIDASLTLPAKPINTLVLKALPPIWRLRLDTDSTAPLADDSDFTPGQSRTFSNLTAGAAKVVFLERLADPSQATGATNPYVVVDQVAIPTATRPLPAWFHWPNRPFISQGELALVPKNNVPATPPIASLVRDYPLLLDATYTPSRFAGNAVTVTPAAVASVGLDRLPSHQLSKWREPGKLNVNTLISGTDARAATANNIVWSILMSGTNVPNPFPGTSRTRTTPAIPGGGGTPATPASPGRRGTPGSPARSTAQLLSLNINTSPIQDIYSAPGNYSGANASLNPFFSHAHAIRLANTATVRSQVFAIWITVRVSDDSPDAPPPVTKRLFAIVDRSVPVGYSPGENLNVRDCIKIRRYLD